MAREHAGWPATPGIADAVAILTRGIDAERLRTADSRRRARRDHAHRVAGAALAAMPQDHLAGLVDAFPELAPTIARLREDGESPARDGH